MTSTTVEQYSAEWHAVREAVEEHAMVLTTIDVVEIHWSDLEEIISDITQAAVDAIEKAGYRITKEKQDE